MGNQKSKKCKAKRAKQPKALKSKHQAWDKKSDGSASKSGSAFEKFFSSLLCFQWFCNKRRSDAAEDEDDIMLSRMAWHHARSSQEVDPMMDRVPGPRVGGDRIPTRRGGVRPSFVLPHNQPASYEGADVSSSPAPTLSSGAVQSDLIQPLEAMGQEPHRPTKSPEEFGRVFSPLPGSVMAVDHPVSNLLVTGAQAAGFPVRDQSMARYGQLPPLHHTAGAPNPPSSILIDVPLSITTLPGNSSVSGAGQSTEQDSDDEFDFDEVITMPSDDVPSPKPIASDKQRAQVDQQAKEMLATNESGEESDEDLPGSDIPSLEEFVKQEEQKKKEQEKREKKEYKKDRKQQKKEKKREKKMEKKIAKIDRKKLMQKQKEEIKAEKVEKKAAKAERAATEGETKKRSRLATRLHEIIKDSNKLAGDKLEMEQRKLEKKQRKREAKARRKMREIARLELEVKILWQRLERKDKKITQLCTRRDRLDHRPNDIVTDFKLDFRIGEYKRRFNNVKNAVNQLKKIIDRKQMKLEKLAPHLLAEAAKKPHNLACDDLSIESISTIDFDDNCSIASFDSNSENDAAEILDIIDLEDCSDFDSESDSEEEPEDDIDDDDDDFCAYNENETEDEQIAKLFMNFYYCSSCSDDKEAEIDLEAPMAKGGASKPVPRENDSSNVQDVLRKAQERLQKMDECRAAEKERRGAGPQSSKSKPSYSGSGEETATDKPQVKKAFY